MSTPPLVDGASVPDKQAEAAIRAFCGWHIAPQIQQTVVVYGAASPVLFLPTLHLVQLVSIASSTGELLPADAYALDVNGMVRLRRFQGLLWAGSLTVTMLHGFEECPEDVAAVVDTLTNAGAYSIDKLEAQALAPYRIPRLR